MHSPATESRLSNLAHSLAMAPEVLFITRKWSPAVGGMETYSVELVKELKRKAQVDAIVLEGNADGSAPRGMALLGFALKAFIVCLTLKKTHDVVHLGDAAIWPLGLVAKLGRKGAKVILAAHGTDISYHRRASLRGGLYRVYLKLGSRLGKNWRLLANSVATARAAEEVGWNAPAVVPLATSAVFGPSSSKSGRHLLYAGRIIPLKGLSWFTQEVLPLLPKDIELHVAGPIWDLSEATALSDRRVKPLGILSREDLNKAYCSARAVILPNIAMPTGEFEGFGLVAVEAAAAGGVVLAANRDGLVDAVMDGKTGFLVPSGNAEAWAAKIHEIFGWDEARRGAFVETARQTTRSYFNWPRVASDTMAHYHAALRGQPLAKEPVK